ncbi:bifunctional biotin--[acetyl-CoA-carboxylase] ligase/biotin operon repressor BirA [Streptococcus gallolyticus]|nr:bifunctional biotin--[acetyl-CoA-carboxylase] ligase/biotin operon repressor BirA [Streptococcus gallolyticus]MBY5041728.1 bifunctional biotin--[acetyl-CoA-carboxylase] ligase/biotin operon repressor BirA [Streptococcus gallolyticus]
MKTYEKIYLLLAQAEDSISGEELAKKLGISRTAVWKAIQQLEKQGLVIEAVQNVGYKLIKGDLLVADWISQGLAIPVHYQAHSRSTQLDAKIGLESGNVAPALYLAPSQEGARGRFGRAFFAPTGGIYMTLHLTPNASFSTIKPYTILVAAAIVKAIENLTGLEPQVKWVNDIYLKGKKIAGILTEAISSIETQTVTDMMIGVGLNFHLERFPQELENKAGNLFEQAPTLSRNELIAEIWRVFFTTSDDQLIKIYKEKSLVLGKQVSFVENQITFHGQARVITDTGELIVQLENGQEKILSSGEISLSSWNAE